MGISPFIRLLDAVLGAPVVAMGEAPAGDEADDETGDDALDPHCRGAQRGGGEQLQPHVRELYAREYELRDGAEDECDDQRARERDPCPYC